MDEEGRPVHWVRAWFYWLRGTSGSKDLQLNIDGGIYREVSISWRYRKAMCSICGGAIQQCSHVPGREYEGKRCTFTIDEVAEVLEGSIVYKGAEPGTRLEGGERIASSGAIDRELEIPGSGADSTLTDLGRYREIFNRQSRRIRSVLIVAEDLDRVRGLAWLANLAGIRTRVLSVEIPEARDERSLEPADLIWIDRERLERIDRENALWRGVFKRARFCVWTGLEEAQESEVRKRSAAFLASYPGWQLKSESRGEDSGLFFELIREEQ